MRNVRPSRPPTHEILLRPAQMRVFTCDKRFRVLVAGRRFGKTYLAAVELLRAASVPGRMVWYLGPSYKQAKRIAWNRLKELTRPFWKWAPHETDLTITLYIPRVELRLMTARNKGVGLQVQSYPKDRLRPPS